MINQKCFYTLILFITFFIHGKHANAASTIVEPLHFGTIVVINNDTVGQVTIKSDGDITVSGPVAIKTAGQPAQLLFSSLPTYTQLTVTANVLTATTASAGTTEQFTLINVETPSPISSDGLGTAIVMVGGTLQTSGVGTGVGNYLDTTYSATFEVVVNF